MRAADAEEEYEGQGLLTVGAAVVGGVVAGPLGVLVLGAGGLAVEKLMKGEAMLPEAQMLAQCREVIASEVKIFERGATVQLETEVPDTDAIPIQDPQQWLKVPDVICVFVDMKDSTRLSATAHDKSTASAFQLFTGGAVRILNTFGPAYIDVRGDGAFALFNKGSEHRALVAAVSFKTFAHEIAVKKIKERTDQDIGCHVGIDQKTVLVRKIGMKRVGGRTDRQNEVWAGKPVNMAAKLASMSEHNQIVVSDRFFGRLSDDHARVSCGCGKSGQQESLWSELDLSNDSRFDFPKAHVLRSNWCINHGSEFADALLRATPAG